MKLRRLLFYSLAFSALTLAGCTSTDSPPASTDTTTVAEDSSVEEPIGLARGTFVSTHGVKGDVTVEQTANLVSVRLTSYSSGGNQLRLQFVDVPVDALSECVPESATTASVGGTPAGPSSSFRVGDVSSFGEAGPQKFTAVVLLGQNVGEGTTCVEPVLAVAPLKWSEG